VAGTVDLERSPLLSAALAGRLEECGEGVLRRAALVFMTPNYEAKLRQFQKSSTLNKSNL
jgi:hypothetical protein